MNIHVISRGIALRPMQQGEIEERVFLSLWRFQDSIRRVDVYVSDVKDASGDLAMSIVIRVNLRGRIEFSVSALRPSLKAASTVASRKARRRTRKSVNRQKRLQRMGLKQARAA